MTGFLEERVPDALRGQRLDLTLAQLFPDYSRTRLKAWIEAGRVLVDGAIPKPRDVVRGGELVRVMPLEEPVVTVAPEAIALDIVHEDDGLDVVEYWVDFADTVTPGVVSDTLRSAAGPLLVRLELK